MRAFRPPVSRRSVLEQLTARSLIAGFTSMALCSERQVPRPEVTVLFAVGATAAAPSAPGELGPSEVHNALVRGLPPHRAMAPSGLTQALAPGSEPSARRGKPAAGDSGVSCPPLLRSGHPRLGGPAERLAAAPDRVHDHGQFSGHLHARLGRAAP